MTPFDGPQRILILGATGPAGLIGTKIALERGHSVIVYARTPSKLPEDITENIKVTLVQGELSSEDVKAKLLPILSNLDSIASFLGPSVNGFPMKGTDYLDFWTFLLPHLRALPTPPYLVVMCTLSITDSKDASNYLVWLVVSGIRMFGGTIWKQIQSMKAIWLAEKERSDGVKWTVSRVGLLQDWEQKGEGAKAGYVGRDGWTMKQGRADLAAWSVREAEKREWTGEFPALS